MITEIEFTKLAKGIKRDDIDKEHRYTEEELISNGWEICRDYKDVDPNKYVTRFVWEKGGGNDLLRVIKKKLWGNMVYVGDDGTVYGTHELY